MANEVLYGFANLKDQFSERVLTVGEEHVSAAIGLTLESHNQIVAATLGIFSAPTEKYQVNFRSLSAGKLQPMDENGRPRIIKSSRYTVGFPIRMGGAGIGETFVAEAKMTIGDVNDQVARVLMADIRWMRDQMLAALFASATHTYTDDEYGAITVQPLANGDTVTYVKNDGASEAVDTHQLAQAGAIADATNPFPTIYEELIEHPENAGDVVVFVPTANKQACRGLATFTEVVDANIRVGANADVVTGAIGMPHPGKVFGYCEHCWLVEWKALPTDYLIATTTLGMSALNMRQDPEAELQGLILKGRENAPFSERFWYRRAGFGAFNRVGALAYRVGNGTYAVPTGYTPPIP